jgi:hypothetical protein
MASLVQLAEQLLLALRGLLHFHYGLVLIRRGTPGGTHLLSGDVNPYAQPEGRHEAPPWLATGKTGRSRRAAVA